MTANLTIPLILADLAGGTEEEVKEHIVTVYSGTNSNDESVTISADSLRAQLAERKLLIAYESVGDYGCDSGAFFLFQHQQANMSKPTYQLIVGSHCSCYGFEGQGELENVDVEYLKAEEFCIGLRHHMGGYDDEAEENLSKTKAYLAAHLTQCEASQ